MLSPGCGQIGTGLALDQIYTVLSKKLPDADALDMYHFMLSVELYARVQEQIRLPVC